MPVLMFTDQEILDASIRQARESRDAIFNLMDLDKTPLAPGETVADRHHKIAKAGKRLALAMTAMENIFKVQIEAALRAHDSEVLERSQQPNPDKPESN